MGGVAKTVKNAFSNPIRAATAVGTMGTSELLRNSNLPIASALARSPETASNALLGTHYGQTGTPDIGGGGPFQVDQAQLAADKAAITGLGKSQYDESLAGIDTAGKAAQDYAAETFKKMLPNTAEDYNAGHLLNSTGYQAEAARQASSLANEVANQVAQQKLQALSGRQGFDTSALQRGMSLEDFTNQANVAKTIGAQMAPQPPSGKSQTGSVLQGVGALAPLAGLFMGGPAGAATAAASGALPSFGLTPNSGVGNVATAMGGANIMGRPVRANQTANYRAGK